MFFTLACLLHICNLGLSAWCFLLWLVWLVFFTLACLLGVFTLACLLVFCLRVTWALSAVRFDLSQSVCLFLFRIVWFVFFTGNFFKNLILNLDFLVFWGFNRHFKNTFFARRTTLCLNLRLGMVPFSVKAKINTSPNCSISGNLRGWQWQVYCAILFINPQVIHISSW